MPEIFDPDHQNVEVFARSHQQPHPPPADKAPVLRSGARLESQN